LKLLVELKLLLVFTHLATARGHAALVTRTWNWTVLVYSIYIYGDGTYRGTCHTHVRVIYADGRKKRVELRGGLYFAIIGRSWWLLLSEYPNHHRWNRNWYHAYVYANIWLTGNIYFALIYLSSLNF
jgi:hypothetical protein